MTVEEYLHSSFEVEPDYLDGELVERHVGSLPHAATKGRMLELLRGLPLDVYMSITMVMSPTRCRVADLAAWAEEPERDYPEKPGELVIEILEEEDRFVEMVERLADYQAWGFRRVWLVDPWTLKLFVYDDSGYHEVPAYELPEFGAKLTAAEIFAGQKPQQ